MGPCSRIMHCFLRPGADVRTQVTAARQRAADCPDRQPPQFQSFLFGHHRHGAFRRFNAIQSRTVSVPLRWDASSRLNVTARIYDLEIRAVAYESLLYVYRIARLWRVAGRSSVSLTARAIRRCACSIKRLAAVAEIESSYFMSILSRLSECSWRQPQ
jgi:hypothetical protein